MSPVKEELQVLKNQLEALKVSIAKLERQIEDEGSQNVITNPMAVTEDDDSDAAESAACGNGGGEIPATQRSCTDWLKWSDDSSNLSSLLEPLVGDAPKRKEELSKFVKHEAAVRGESPLNFHRTPRIIRSS